MATPENPSVKAREWLESLPICNICGDRISGSHYHCSRCKSTEVTSMYGHYHSMHYPSDIILEGHFRCDPGACDNAQPAVRGKKP